MTFPPSSILGCCSTEKVRHACSRANFHARSGKLSVARLSILCWGPHSKAIGIINAMSSMLCAFLWWWLLLPHTHKVCEAVMSSHWILLLLPGPTQCFHRAFDNSNVSYVSSHIYSIETGLHEMLAQSKYRTLRPEEADLFYVPVYASCWAWPLHAWADFPW